MSPSNRAHNACTKVDRYALESMVSHNDESENESCSHAPYHTHACAYDIDTKRQSPHAFKSIGAHVHTSAKQKLMQYSMSAGIPRKIVIIHQLRAPFVAKITH